MYGPLLSLISSFANLNILIQRQQQPNHLFAYLDLTCNWFEVLVKHYDSANIDHDANDDGEEVNDGRWG